MLTVNSLSKKPNLLPSSAFRRMEKSSSSEKERKYITKHALHVLGYSFNLCKIMFGQKVESCIWLSKYLQRLTLLCIESSLKSFSWFRFILISYICKGQDKPVQLVLLNSRAGLFAIRLTAPVLSLDCVKAVSSTSLLVDSPLKGRQENVTVCRQNFAWLANVQFI